MFTTQHTDVGDKGFITTWVLSLLFGVLGVDRFYLGKVGTGLLKLLTFGGLGLWWLIDLILILTNSMKDKNGKRLKGYSEGNNRKVAIIVTLIFVVVSGVYGVTGSKANYSAPPERVDVNGLTIKEACDKVREKGWKVTSITTHDGDMTLNCSNTTQRVSSYIYGIISNEVRFEYTSSPSNVQTEAPSAQTSPAESKVPAEFASALRQADSYANRFSMSKQGVYDQLVSEFGGKFTPEAAQYAVDNVKSDWNANALKKAKTYQDSLNQSPAAIHDQLTSPYGEKFTQAEADYAIEHLNK